MEREVFEAILRQGESTTVEFKRCGTNPGPDALETICSFANRNGGSLFLGVTDNGEVTGVPSANLLEIQRNLINCTYNPNLFNMPPSLEFESIEYDDRSVLRVWVPPTQGVFRFKGRVYDRVADADVVLKIRLPASRKDWQSWNQYSEAEFPDILSLLAEVHRFHRAAHLSPFAYGGSGTPPHRRVP